MFMDQDILHAVASPSLGSSTKELYKSQMLTQVFWSLTELWSKVDIEFQIIMGINRFMAHTMDYSAMASYDSGFR